MGFFAFPMTEPCHLNVDFNCDGSYVTWILWEHVILVDLVATIINILFVSYMILCISLHDLVYCPTFCIFPYPRYNVTRSVANFGSALLVRTLLRFVSSSSAQVQALLRFELCSGCIVSRSETTTQLKKEVPQTDTRTQPFRNAGASCCGFFICALGV